MEIDKNIIANSMLAYSLPGSTEFILATLSDITTASEASNLTDYDFVFSPFDKNKEAQLLLKISSRASGRKFSVSANNNIDLVPTSKATYSQQFREIKQTLVETSIDKIVLSKLKIVNENTEDLYHHFISLKNLYPSAFSYLIHLPGIGTWMGASPELLLKNKESGWHSKAIAGTKSNGNQEDKWSSKDIKEHALVEDHYREVLKKLGLRFSISESYTIAAGSISHICSDIEIANISSNILGSLLEEIHPSPALSGFPKELVISKIKQIENHDRAYYCGFLGPINHEGSTQLYANIRCMQVFRNGFALYLGGGILADSELEKEWLETEIKAETMLNAIRSVNSPAGA